MKFLRIKMILPGLLFAFLTTACHHTDDISIGGKGGSATLLVYPQHHTISKNLMNMEVYIKYNTSDASASYDDSAACAPNSGNPFATLSGLKAGSYYLLAKGFDTSVHQNVIGGIPYTITSETSQTVLLPVSE